MKLKVKGACTVKITISNCSSNKGEPLITIKVKRKQSKLNKNEVPTTLLKRIQACSTASELMALLFATPAKDEAVMRAFDRRIEELEKKDKTNNIHSLNSKNNGSTTHTTTA